MTDRIQNLCFVVSLAALLVPFSGCQRNATETPAQESVAATEERAHDDAVHQGQRYPKELLSESTLQMPDLGDVVQRLPVIEYAPVVRPGVQPVSTGDRAGTVQLPLATSDGLQIQVGKSTSNIIRLPNIAQHTIPANQDVRAEPTDAPSRDDGNAELDREQSLWAAAGEHSASTELDVATPTVEAEAQPIASTPARTVVVPVRRLPAVVEQPPSAESVAIPADEQLPETPEFPVVTELTSDHPLHIEIENRQPAIDPMHAVNRQAVGKIRHAFSLAQRGASYSARVELVEALRTVSEALDMRDGSRQHTDALKRGFRALEEANDFHQRGLGEELDMEVLVAAHRTPVLKKHDLTQITPLFGLQQYLTYAQEQLTIASGQQPTASLALYGLGRLQVDLSKEEKDALPQAIVFHQAAVLADGMNYKAANELGVLLAKYGQYTQARDMLAHSVRVCPQVASWQNLGKIHAHLGEADLARRAMHESQLAARSGAGRDGQVRWVDPATLAGTIETNEPVSHAPARREVENASPARNVSQGESEGLMRLIPWRRRGE